MLVVFVLKKNQEGNIPWGASKPARLQGTNVIVKNDKLLYFDRIGDHQNESFFDKKKL